jgi:hypothetical protein
MGFHPPVEGKHRLNMLRSLTTAVTGVHLAAVFAGSDACLWRARAACNTARRRTPIAHDRLYVLIAATEIGTGGSRLIGRAWQ